MSANGSLSWNLGAAMVLGSNIGSTVDAESITIVSMEKLADGKTFFGVGFGANIVHGAVSAIVSSLNRMMRV